MIITYGSREGKWFTQWRFDELISLATTLGKRLGVDEFHVWYAVESDFHRMSWKIGPCECLVSLYKIYRFDIGDDTVRVQRSGLYEAILKIQEITGHVAGNK